MNIDLFVDLCYHIQSNTTKRLQVPTQKYIKVRSRPVIVRDKDCLVLNEVSLFITNIYSKPV